MQQSLLLDGYHDNDAQFLLDACRLTGSLKGKRVLDIGCDYLGNLLREMVLLEGVQEAVGLNPILEPFAYNSQLRVEALDAANTGYANEYFDLVLSSAAFEHVNNLSEVLQESWRILKPGGYLYTQFGPIWSGKFGHHLWTIVEGQLWNYHNVKLPPFAHLIMTEEAVREYCRNHSSMSDSQIHILVDYVFHSPEQNQLMYEDYEEIIFASPFEVLNFSGIYDPTLGKEYADRMQPETLHALRKRFPHAHGFMYDGINCLLYKPLTQIVKPETQTAEFEFSEAALLTRSPNNGLHQVSAPSEIISGHSSTQILSRPPLFHRCPPSLGLLNVNEKIDFESNLRHHILCPIMPDHDPHWQRLIETFIRAFRPTDGLGLILLNLTQNEENSAFETWLKQTDLSSPQMPDLHLLIADEIEPDVLLSFLLQKVDTLLLTKLTPALLEVPLIYQLIAHYKVVLQLNTELDSSLGQLQLAPDNILRAFNLYKLLSNRLPDSRLLQLNHRFIADWNSQHAEQAKKI